MPALAIAISSLPNLATAISTMVLIKQYLRNRLQTPGNYHLYLLQLCHRLFCECRINIVKQHMRALLAQLPADLKPDTLAGAGYNGYFVLKRFCIHDCFALRRRLNRTEVCTTCFLNVVVIYFINSCKPLPWGFEKSLQTGLLFYASKSAARNPTFSKPIAQMELEKQRTLNHWFF